MDKKKIVLAKDAVVGKEYLSPKGQRVKIEKVEPTKICILVFIPGYRIPSRVDVQPTYELTEIQGGAIMAPRKHKTPAKATEPKAKKEKGLPAKSLAVKLPKVGEGKAAPRVIIDGFKLRENYRARLSQLRAAECEAANHDKCSCRCGGALHGKSHKEWFKEEAALFESSPNGAITAKQVLGMIKFFGGKPQEHKPKAAKAKATAKKAAKKEPVAA